MFSLPRSRMDKHWGLVSSLIAPVVGSKVAAVPFVMGTPVGIKSKFKFKKDI